MPTCTPEAVLAVGAVFQETDARGLQLARIALLWQQNGSTGTANSLYATGKAFDACQPGQLDFCLTTLLWLCAGSPGNAASQITLAKSYQGTAPGLQAMCETISEWIERGSPGTVSSIQLIAAQFQGLSDKALTIVEIVLLESIYAKNLTFSQLLTDAQVNGFLKCEPGQLMLLNAYFYCQLS